MPNAGVLGIPTNNASPPPPVLPMKPSNEILPPLPQRRTLDRSLRNLNNGHIIHQNGINAPSNDNMKNMADGDCGLTQVRTSSMRRHKARNHGSVPGSPRIIRGPSTELLQNNKYAASPVPIRAHGVKRSQQSRLGRADNLSSGSLNSIEV